VRIKTKQDLVDALADTLIVRVVDAISSRKIPSGALGNRMKRELAHGAVVIIVNAIFSSEASDVKASQAKRDLVETLVDGIVDAISSGKVPEGGKANQKTRDRVDALVDNLLDSIVIASDKVDALVKATVDGIRSKKK
jgi:hypothetical protein